MKRPPAPVLSRDGISLYRGDCRDVLPGLPAADVVIADPPYEETELHWDEAVDGWLDAINLKPSGSLWCFGSFRMFMRSSDAFDGWSIAQDVVWEKHNGSGILADRFRRVHEHVVQFFRGRWSEIYKDPVYTNDATKRTIRRKMKPEHWGRIGASSFKSEDGGPRLQRSVIQARSCHGYADHPTQKPTTILAPLIEYSCPPGGLVVDPFCGAGSTLVAAKELGRRAIGVEKSKAYCSVAARRLAQGLLL